ncbi:MAG: hypothetical protein EAZ92_01380 [Candidatus Kapaibacterium sp.]|nr:MAG: hypothetical protein EAZ92_01380 [Candidatus Kapabacteria bacterium]
MLHTANILLHVSCGTIALLLGFVAIFSRKGGRVHIKSGQIFLVLLVVVITTALVGVFIFGRNTFLLVITLLAAYQGFSGNRILQTRANTPHWADILAGVLTLSSAAYFVYFLRQIGMIWSPTVMYSTLGWLFGIILYDVVRYFIPTELYKEHRIWLLEHIVKLMAAFGALFSAFVGTVLPNFQPYSQLLPSVVVTLGMAYFLIVWSKKRTPSNRAFVERISSQA